MCNCGSNINGNLCCYDNQAKETLGLVASSYRAIKDGNEYNHFFPKSSVTEKIVVPDGTVKDTVKEIEVLVDSYNWQTKDLSKLFKRNTLPETLEAIWIFFYSHYQYKLDRDEVEELRTPARAWHDRKTGIDCDCYSISISSVLTNLGIKHKFRVTKYGAGWQHIYVIVPVPNSIKNEYWVLDCVLDRFNYEKTYTDKFDYKMETLGIPIAVLSGTENEAELNTILSGADFDEPGFGAVSSLEDDLGALKNHLVRTRNYIVKNPHSVLYHGGATKNVQMLNHAIKHWDNENTRETALNGLAEAEHELNVQVGLAGFDEYDADEDVSLMGLDEDSLGDEVNVLGKVKAKKKFFQAVKTANKKIVEAHKKVGKKIVQGTKKLLKAVVRYNPLTLAARGGFLLVIKKNMFGFSKALYPAIISESEAKAKGYSNDEISKAKNAYSGVEKLFVKTLQGKEDSLKKQIKIGAEHHFKNHPLNGVENEESLGEPISVGASVTAASTPIVAGAKILSKAGLKAAGNKNFMDLVTNFFKKNKEKIFAVAKKGVQKIKDKKAAKQAKKEGGTSSDDGSEGGSDDGTNDGDSSDNSSSNGSSSNNSSSERTANSSSSSSDEDGSDENGTVDSTPTAPTASANKALIKTSANTTTDATEGFFAKASNWVKENPVVATATGLIGGLAITYAVSSTFRNKVNGMFSGKKKTGLNGVKRKTYQKKAKGNYAKNRKGFKVHKLK